jgi:hypothetical protein
LPPLATSEGGVLTPKAEPLPIDPGLLERFLEAERSVEWKSIDPLTKTAGALKGRGRTDTRGRPKSGSRIAYYHDETARIERRSVGSEKVVTVTSGPVGALLLVGECHRRGLPSSLASRNAGAHPDFPDGAVEARWDPKTRRRRYALPFTDVVELARYALA